MRSLARGAALLAAYAATRLFALTLLPMFVDERIHLRWAFWITQGRRLKIPFFSGRGLSVYLLALVAPYARDPLLAGRLLTAAVGVATLYATWRLGVRLWDTRVGILAAVFYVACPFTLFYDRMVLTDAFLSAFAALTLLDAVNLVRSPRLATGLRLGLWIGLGIASKATGLFLVATPLVALVVLTERPAAAFRAAVRPLAVAYGLAAAVAGYPLWLFFRKTDELAGAMAGPDPEVMLAGTAAANLRLAAEWLWAYWTAPLAVLAAAGVLLAFLTREGRRESVLLALLGLGPVVAFVAVSQVWYPRYLLFTTVPILVLAAAGLNGLGEAARRALSSPPAVARTIPWAMAALALLPALRFDLALWTDPAAAPFVALDRFQYVTGWPSGYGLRDSLAFLRRLSAGHPEGIVVVAAGPSTTAAAARLAFFDLPVEVRFMAPTDPAVRGLLTSLAARRPTCVVVSPAQGGAVGPGWAGTVTRVFASYKPDGTIADEIYRVCSRADCLP